ncbi:hypothetical protein DBR23_23395 [Acidovorax sp. HMWF018]|uniref:hypothetical protein n=1 Tax=Acidovorax sp. HMWF018 TaxID=2056855 RepID=UPI000D37FD97|nr:hypothetical protein [Acidovorax sp. HMWF018]PTT35454.1 hypothetical protein DBR23_23395 [Acidovorax sp. HMWF018]
MAKAPKTLSKAEIKDAKINLKAALKVVNDEHSKFVSDHKAAEKTLAVAKKEAEKAVAVAQKAVDAAAKKLEKATAAADKGRAKINAQLAALEPAAEPATA